MATQCLTDVALADAECVAFDGFQRTWTKMFTMVKNLAGKKGLDSRSAGDWKRLEQTYKVTAVDSSFTVSCWGVGRAVEVVELGRGYCCIAVLIHCIAVRSCPSTAWFDVLLGFLDFFGLPVRAASNLLEYLND